MPADPSRVQAVFLAAVELTEAASRAALLDRECGSDATLRERVERLLEAHQEDSFLDPKAVDPSVSVSPDAISTSDPSQATGDFTPDAATITFGNQARAPESGSGSGAAVGPGTVIAGRYTLAEVIGEGGMGSVYLAQQTEPVKRRVAVKVIKAGIDSQAVLARFDAERQALALMDHPHIARIYDGGVTPSGQPFFVMELVRGVPLTDYCDSKQLTVDARLQLFVSVCQAVQHAHQKGVIHRDLKPGNVLVTEIDGRPTPKVIDFGVAKATEQKLTDMSLADLGTIVGTPAYMSPEQADPLTTDIDTRTDVYALGVMLYELLTGSPPIDAKQFKRGAILEMLRLVREGEPPRPSTKLSTAHALPNIAANRGIEPAKLAKLLRGELDWVVMKALEKDRTRRYETANGLARDIQRYLADEVVEARPPSTGYRLKKFVRRHKGQVLAASVVLVALIAGIASSTWFGLEAREQAGIADKQRGDALAARDRADAATRLAIQAEAQTKAEKHKADVQAALANFRLGLQAATDGSVDKGLFLMLRAWRQAPEDEVAFRTIIRRNLAGWSSQLPRLRQAYRLENVTRGAKIGFGDPEGRTILTWHLEDGGPRTGGTIRCWDASTGKPVGQPLPIPGQNLKDFSSDGRWLHLNEPGKKNTVVDRTTGKEVISASNAFEYCALTDLHDVFSAAKDGEAVFWELPSGKQLPGRVPVTNRKTEQERRTFKLTRAADGRPMALAFNIGVGQDGRVELVDLTTGKPAEMSLSGASSPSISYDGRVAMTGARHMVDWWNLTSGRHFGERWKPRVDIDDPDTDRFFARDSLELHALGKDGQFRFYDLATGLQRGGDQLAPVSQATPDGRLLYTLDDASTVRVWDSSLCRLQATATANPHAAPGIGVVRLNDAFFAPDHSRVLLSADKGTAFLLDTHTGGLLGPPLRQPGIYLNAFSRDGRFLATAPLFSEATTPLVILRDGHTGKAIGKPWVSRTYLGTLAFSPDDKTLAVGAVGGTYLLDEPAHTLRKLLPEPGNCIYGSLVFDPEGKRLVTQSGWGWPGGGGLRIWDLTTDQPLSPFRSHKRLVLPPQAAWDGGELVYNLGEPDSELRRLSSDGKEDRGGPWPTGRSDWRDAAMIGHTFSPDGRRLAVNGGHVRVRQFDTRTGQPVGATVNLHYAGNIQYSSDGKLLAINSGENIVTEVDHWGGRARAANSVTLWDADTGWPLGPTLQSACALMGRSFADQDRTMVTVSGNGIVHRWPVPQPVIDDPDRFETWLRARGGRKFVGEEAVQLTVDEWQAALRKMNERWPHADPALAERSDDLTGWHRQRANDAAEVNNDRGELFHLTRLAELCPKDLAIHARIAAIHARVAGRLPAGAARDQQWKLADAAAKLAKGWTGEDNWNELRSVDATNREAWNEALWHLDRRIEKGGWNALAERAEVHSKLGNKAKQNADLEKALSIAGNKDRELMLRVAEEWARQDRWRESASLYATGIEGSADPAQMEKAALAQLKAGNFPEHARICQDLLKSLPDNAPLQLRVGVWSIFALSPKSRDDWTGPLTSTEQAIKALEAALNKATTEQQKTQLRPLNREWLTTHAALLHRAGKHGDAIELLNKAMKLTPQSEGGPSEWVWLALATAATEKAPFTEARRWLSRTRAALPKREGSGLWDAVVLEVLVAEADLATRGKNE